MKFLNTHHYFDGGIRWGSCNWNRNGEKTGSIGFEVSTIEGDEYIRLHYTHTDNSTNEKTELNYKAQIVSTPCNYGGRRWWFICPLNLDGCACNRRVGVLYLAGSKYFGCRHCNNLTYTSSKESHKFDSMFLKIGVDPKIGNKIFKEDK
jgi:hypothetical protein